MTSGSWLKSTYETSKTAAKRDGYKTPFRHTEDIERGRTSRGVHPTMSPETINNHGAQAGKNVRESVNPNATPVAILFGVTSTTKRVPQILHEKLPQIHALFEEQGIAEPEILFGGIGDANGDTAPLQIGQFESGNRMDENLGNLWLEGGESTGNHDSYELAAFFMARHTQLNGKRGYLFIVGDERPYTKIKPEQVRNVIGGTSSKYQESLTTKQIFDELRKTWEPYFLYTKGGHYSEQEVLDSPEDAVTIGWRTLLGDNALVVDDPQAIPEVICLTLAIMEGQQGVDTGMEALREAGFEDKQVKLAGRALQAIGAAVAEGSGKGQGQ